MSRIDDKIEELEKYLLELDDFLPNTFDEYLDVKTKAACERYFEKIAETFSDLAFLVIKDKKLRMPDSEDTIFDVLSKAGIISEILAKKLHDAKGMRNIIAHKYGTVNDKLVFNSITEELIDDVKEFLEQIRKQ